MSHSNWQKAFGDVVLIKRSLVFGEISLIRSVAGGSATKWFIPAPETVNLDATLDREATGAVLDCSPVRERFAGR